MRKPMNLISGAATLILAGTISSTGLLAKDAVPAPEAQVTTPSASDKAPSKSVATRGWLGAKVQSIDADMAAALGMSEPKGVLITEVIPDGPAALAGLKANDVIVSMNGQPVTGGESLAEQIAGLSSGTEVDFKVWRADSEQGVKVQIGQRTARNASTQPDAAASATDSKPGRLGLKLIDGSNGEGVVIAEVAPQSDGAKKGLTSGDVILEVDGTPATTAEQVVESIKGLRGKGREAVLLLVKSGADTRSVAVRFSVAG